MLKTLGIALGAGLLGGLLISLVMSDSGFLGAAQNRTTVGNPWSFTNTTSPGGGGGVTFASTTMTGFKIAQDGTRVTGLNTGTCNIYADVSIAATSTEAVDCGGGALGQTALQGISAGDVCWIQQATSTTPVLNGIDAIKANASSTSGFLTLGVSNLTGGTFTWTAAASSSWQYLCLDL